MIELKTPLECDILIAGGGAGGMQAAIDGADAGAKVIIAEKANTRRSGNCATGNDHFQCYIPEVHGDEETWLKLLAGSQEAKGGRDRDIMEMLMRESKGVVHAWESYGINMRPHGDWEFTGHCHPGLQGIHLKFEGQNMKPILTKEALKRGVTILNRHPLAELVANQEGEICGAILVDLTEETPKIQVVRAKAVILATAGTFRISGDITMGWMFNSHQCPVNTGAGKTAAYKVGARMVNFDSVSSGRNEFKFFRRGGKNTWVGVFSDIEGKPIGPFVQKPDWRYGDFTADVRRDVFTENDKAGNPVFMNCTNGTDEDLDYMLWGLQHEGNGATLDHLAAEGFDFRKQQVMYGYGIGGGPGPYGNGIDANGKGETTVPGLYAAGQILGNGIGGISPAACLGRVAARNAAEYAKGRDFEPAETYPAVQENAELYTRLMENEVSTATPTWQEANIAIMQTNWEFLGRPIRSTRMLTVGLSHMRRIKAKLDRLHCSGSHEFIRCLEVRELALQSELSYLGALSHKESRGNIKNVDYPDTDPALNNTMVTIQLVGGEPVTSYRKKRM